MYLLVLVTWALGTALMIYFGCFYSQAYEDAEQRDLAFKRSAKWRYLGFALTMLALALVWFI